MGKKQKKKKEWNILMRKKIFPYPLLILRQLDIFPQA